jgi:hypothetical protein
MSWRTSTLNVAKVVKDPRTPIAQNWSDIRDTTARSRRVM